MNNDIFLKPMNLAYDGTSREDKESSVLPRYDATQNNEFVFGAAQEDPRKDEQSKQLIPCMKKIRKKDGVIYKGNNSPEHSCS